MAQIVDDLDGMFFTGSPSNVEPSHYGGDESRPGTLHDPHRDATTLPLIPRAIAAGVPVLGVCRGFQEMNVAFGGTLWQHVHEVPGQHDHREDKAQPLDVQYGPAHEVTLAPGSLLRGIAGRDRIEVNSLHRQGVRALAPDLRRGGARRDGLVEAFRVTMRASFALAVQWHPEWQVLGTPFQRRCLPRSARRRANAPQRRAGHR